MDVNGIDITLDRFDLADADAEPETAGGRWQERLFILM